jgi:hypothetical protein
MARDGESGHDDAVHDAADPQPCVREMFDLLPEVLRVLLVLAGGEDPAVDPVPPVAEDAEIGDCHSQLSHRGVLIENVSSPLGKRRLSKNEEEYGGGNPRF